MMTHDTKQIHGNIHPFKPESGMTVKQLLDGMGRCSFGARALFQAAETWKEMVADKGGCVKLMGLGGALMAAGMGEIIIECMKEGYIDALVTTGANLTHDIIGPKFHSFGSPEADDSELKGMHLYRVYDTYVESEGYSHLEDILSGLFPKLEQKEMSTSRFLAEIGGMLGRNGHRCMISEAAKYKVPIFCPAVGDSILGFQIWMHQQSNALRVNPLLDQKEILDIVYATRKTGAIIVGGGTSKNYVTQAVQTAEKPLSYAVQVTMDRPEPGGVSGASLKEAISWGKVASGAKLAEVVCDATIALPILVSYLKG